MPIFPNRTDSYYTRSDEEKGVGAKPLANGNGHASYRLIEAILACSVASTWDRAKLEWSLDYIYFTEPDCPGVCLCGHSPIREHCVLVNRVNDNRAVVGNVCVTKFLELNTEEVFKGFRRIMKDREAALNVPAVEHAYANGWIDPWERGFYQDTCRKNKHQLSRKQLAIRVRINEAVLFRVTAQEGQSHA